MEKLHLRRFQRASEQIQALSSLVFALAIAVCSGQQLEGRHQRSIPTVDERRVAVLNSLRDEINGCYGYRDGAPRINLGPCGKFAKAFTEHWNAHFTQKIHIVFVMANDESQCWHVLVKLPDGNYYDGGNGVISGRTLLVLYPKSRIDEMMTFDLKLLDQRSYGLSRDYPLCPNYSDETISRLIEKYLATLPGDP